MSLSVQTSLDLETKLLLQCPKTKEAGYKVSQGYRQNQCAARPDPGHKGGSAVERKPNGPKRVGPGKAGGRQAGSEYTHTHVQNNHSVCR